MKKKLLILIPAIAVIIIGITYAWWDWMSTTSSASFTVTDLVINYSGGPDITGIQLVPVTSKEKGEADGTAVVKTITASANGKAYLDLNMTLETYPTDLKDDTLVWGIYNGNTLINYSNLGNNNQGDVVEILKGEPITETPTTFKLYIWIDGRVDNPNRMQRQDFKFVLSASASNEMPPKKLSDKVIELAGDCTSWESGFSGVCATSAYDDNGVTKYHEYRYIGANVNNWVRFNNEDYRIIGVFDDYSHGVEKNKLVKLISADQLFASSWGIYNDSSTNYTSCSGNNNNWAQPSNLNVLLNTYFFDSNAISTYGTCENLMYYISGIDNSSKTLDCTKIKRYGIQTQELRNYIQPASWYLKGYSSNSYYRQNFYTCERSDSSSILNCDKSSATGAAIKVEKTEIGLMYVSDYLYASGYYSSSQNYSANQYYYGRYNWLYNGTEWTITPIGGNDSNLSYVDNAGAIGEITSSSSNAVRPTFYLKPNIRIISGDGTYTNPYVIG